MIKNGAEFLIGPTYSRCGGNGQAGRAARARIRGPQFSTVAISDDPNREDQRHDLERLSQSRAAVAERGQTVSEVLGDKLDQKGNIDITPSR